MPYNNTSKGGGIVLKPYQTIVIFTVLSIFCVLVPHAYADDFRINPFKLNHTPTLCIIEPADSKIPYIGAMAISTTHDSVNEWLSQLNQGLSTPVWNINEVIVPLSSQKGYNYTSCDIQMRYLPQPTNKTDTFETVAQISYDVKNGRASAEIYYLQIVKNLLPSQDYGYTSTNTYSDQPLDYFRLKQSISHELGHAFGEGHYHTSSASLMDQWSKGQTKPPSIMVEVQGENARYFSVTQNDAGQIRVKYGSAGFGGNYSIGLAHELGTSNRQDTSSDTPQPTEPPYCIKEGSPVTGSERILTKTHTSTGMMVWYTYFPGKFYNGCKNSWTWKFVDEKTNKTIPNVYYDILVQQDVMRSDAKEEGQKYFVAQNGTATNDILVKEKVGIIYYWITTFDKIPDQYSDGTLQGSATLFLTVSPRAENFKTVIAKEIEPWVKTDANLWSKNEVSNSEFIQAVQYLSGVGFITIEKPGAGLSHVPSWLKNSAGWWYNGDISDDEFVKSIQFLIDKKIMA